LSSTSFLHEIRKGSSNKASRVVNAIAKDVQKLKAQNTVIEDSGLLDDGATVKGRAVIESGGKLTFTRKITTIPTFKVPFEPDAQYCTFWIKANHTGLFLKDSSKFDNYIKCNNNRHLCLVNTDLDSGYLGQRDGVVGWTAWDLNGENESAWVDDEPTTNNILNTSVGFSITAWVKVSDFSQHNGVNRRVLSKTDDPNNAYTMFVTPTNRAVVAFKHAGNEFKIQTPATLVTDQWYFLVGTFKSSATKEAKIYLNGTVSTSTYSDSVTYPDINDQAGTNLQLFGNGIERLIDPLETDIPPPYDFDTGDWSGQIRDIRIYREKILTQQEITNFNTNRTTIGNVGLGESHIAGFVWSPSTLSGARGFTDGFTLGFH
jgi:concanavalin A-like lectin/glucanase superfamily protein